MRPSLLIAVLALLIGGCAELEVKRVLTENQEGFRYCLPQPYLLVTKVKPATDQRSSKTSTRSSSASETAPDLEYKIIYLPNTQEKFAVRVKSGLGSVNSTLKIQDGWQLTEVGGTVDTKVPETITAITGLLQAIPSLAALRAKEEGQEMKAGLYGFEFDSKGMVTRIYRIGP
jgi:hypothetical protein